MATATVERMYILMGRQLTVVDEAPPGSIVGIIGLQDHVLKTATITTTLGCPSLARAGIHAKPICRVVLDTVSLLPKGAVAVAAEGLPSRLGLSTPSSVVPSRFTKTRRTWGGPAICGRAWSACAGTSPRRAPSLSS